MELASIVAVDGSGLDEWLCGISCDEEFELFTVDFMAKEMRDMVSKKIGGFNDQTKED